MVKKVIVGLSGGVDSAVSALLLQQQGYQVEALFMKNWEGDDDDNYCAAEEDLKFAQQVCDHLGIPLHKANFAAEYWQRVFKIFLGEYEAGRTPNPDILCNTQIKFKAFPEHAKKFDADMMATGHYARITHHDGEVRLLRGLDAAKDQSYFLYGLNQEQLAGTLFPIGHLPKQQVREIAKSHGLANFDRKDSTGICFIGERDFRSFLKEYLPAKPGEIHTDQGVVVGRHEGLMYHTIGQRQGLGIGGRAFAGQQPWYVAKKDVKNNVLVVVQGNAHPLLYSRQLTCRRIHWINPSIKPDVALDCTAKVRYRQKDEPCRVLRADDGGWLVTFARPQRAVTPGQSLVLYRDEQCLGGGVIEEAIP